MTYKPKTTRVERTEVLNYLHEWCHAHNLKVPTTQKDLITAILEDLKQAEEHIGSLELQLEHRITGEEPAYQIEGCLHPNVEWDTERVRPTRICTRCGEEVGPG